MNAEESAMGQDAEYHSELLDAYQDVWQDLVARSEAEPDVAMIAAYIDGQLNEAETRRLGRHIVDCPLAWEILEYTLPEGRALPGLAGDETVAGDMARERRTASVAVGSNQTASPGWTSRRPWQLALAAGWLLAVVCGVSLWWADVPGLKTRMARMEELQRDTAYQLARAEVADLARYAADFGQVYAIGEPTGGLVRTATRPSTLTVNQLPDNAWKEIDHKLISIRKTVAAAEVPNAPEDSAPLRLLEVSGLIMAGRLDEADALLLELEERFPGNEVRNARAVWQFAAARYAPLGEQQVLKDQAVSTLRQIDSKDLPQAWLNLALYYRAENDGPNAVMAAKKYLDTDPDTVVAEIVRQTFYLDTEDGR
jgi:hypothetical protein